MSEIREVIIVDLKTGSCVKCRIKDRMLINITDGNVLECCFDTEDTLKKFLDGNPDIIEVDLEALSEKNKQKETF